MASRRLALNFHQAVRSRSALQAVQRSRRGFASPVAGTTQSTTLSNGLTVSPDRAVDDGRDGRDTLTVPLDCYRILSMGSDLDRRCMD